MVCCEWGVVSGVVLVGCCEWGVVSGNNNMAKNRSRILITPRLVEQYSAFCAPRKIVTVFTRHKAAPCLGSCESRSKIIILFLSGTF
jgi:hypothetical protein